VARPPTLGRALDWGNPRRDEINKPLRRGQRPQGAVRHRRPCGLLPQSRPPMEGELLLYAFNKLCVSPAVNSTRMISNTIGHHESPTESGPKLLAKERVQTRNVRRLKKLTVANTASSIADDNDAYRHRFDSSNTIRRSAISVTRASGHAP
jgi:hypothetical protein